MNFSFQIKQFYFWSLTFVIDTESCGALHISLQRTLPLCFLFWKFFRELRPNQKRHASHVHSSESDKFSRTNSAAYFAIFVSVSWEVAWLTNTISFPRSCNHNRIISFKYITAIAICIHIILFYKMIDQSCFFLQSKELGHNSIDKNTPTIILKKQHFRMWSITPSLGLIESKLYPMFVACLWSFKKIYPF